MGIAYTIDEKFVYYKTDDMINYEIFCPVINFELKENKNEIQIKQFNFEKLIYEDFITDEEFEYEGVKYKANKGKIILSSEPTQLDRIESLLLEEKVEIQQEAIDNYTLELIESGAL